MKGNKAEFKKIVLGVILLCCFAFVVWSYLLATFGECDTNGDIATALIYTVVGAYASYVFASFGEKNSRNRYGIDETGNKRPEGGEKGED